MFLRQLFQRLWRVGEAACHENGALAFIQPGHSGDQHFAARIALATFGHHHFRRGGLIFQPVLPLAFAVFTGLHRRVERGIAAAHAAFHHRHVIIFNAQPLGNFADLLGLERAAINGVNLALQTAQIEKQLFLRRRGADFYQRPRAQNIFLNLRANPPHGISGKAKAAIGVKFLHGAHQPDIAFRNHFANRQAIAAIAHSDFRHQAQMAGHQLMRRALIAAVGIIFRQGKLLIGFQHGEFLNVIEIARQTAFRIGGRSQRSRWGG